MTQRNCSRSCFGSQRRPAGRGKRYRLASGGNGRHPAFERLEDRRMLTSTAFNTIASDLRMELNAAQGSLTNLLNSYHSGDNASIPFLGSSLGNAAQFVPQLQA